MHSFPKRLLPYLGLLWLLACDRNPQPAPVDLVLLQSLPLSVQEPSGLALSNDQLLVVSDADNKVYRINPGTGTVVAALAYTGDDLEGVTQNNLDNSIWVVEESRRELVHLNVNGAPLDTFAMAFNQLDDNSGMEGLSIDPQASRLYIVTEKDPSLLLVVDFDGQIVAQYPLSFANDYSGLCYESVENVLYVLSDESQTITKTSLKGEKIETYRIEVVKAEGIAIDRAKKRCYVVSDEANELYVFELP